MFLFASRPVRRSRSVSTKTCALNVRRMSVTVVGRHAVESLQFQRQHVQQQFQRQRSPHSQSCNASCSKTSVGSSAFARQYRFDRSSTLHVLLSCSPHHRTLQPFGLRCSRSPELQRVIVRVQREVVFQPEGVRPVVVFCSFAFPPTRSSSTFFL